MPTYNLPNIRLLLNEGFIEEELRRMCFDMREFRTVYDALSLSTGKTRIVDLLIEHAERKGLMDLLLSEAKRLNRSKYDAYHPYEQTEYDSHSTSESINVTNQDRGRFLISQPSDAASLKSDKKSRESNADEKVIRNLKSKVDFVIITVREDEYKAVLKRFPKETIYEGNNRSYSISRVILADGSYYLVALVRIIERGEGHGQDAARDAIEDLDPQWLLLVGIAGGVPAIEFTLGDVVAAMRLTDFSVKAAIEQKGMQYAVGGGPMHKQVQNTLALIPAMSDELGDWNSRTSIGMDKPPVELITSNFYGTEDWQKAVKESLMRHFGSSVSYRSPLVTTGAVISSDTLVKDTQTLQQWQEAARQVLDVEMELGGVYIAARRANHEYPILAIRGISDIVGFKRHPDWTEYACQSAAAFTHAFIITKPIEPLELRRENSISPEPTRTSNTSIESLGSLTLSRIGALCEQGEEAFKKNDFLHANHCFTQALNLDPSSQRARLGKVKSLKAEGDVERAKGNSSNANHLYKLAEDAFIEGVPFPEQLIRLVGYERQCNYRVRFTFMIISGNDKDDLIVHALAKDSEDVADPAPILIYPNIDPLLSWSEGKYIKLVRGSIDKGHGIFALSNHITGTRVY